MAHNLQEEPARLRAVIAVEDVHCTLLVRWATRESGRLIQHRPELRAVARGTHAASSPTMTASSTESLAAMQACETSADPGEIINAEGRALRALLRFSC